MKERPILFSGPMVRALLDGSKTQTRRVVKPQPVEQTGWVGGAYWERRPARGIEPADQWCIRDMPQFSPYGQPGDHLWVRETFFAYGRWETRLSAKKGRDEWHFIDMTVECDRAYQYAASEPEVPVVSSRHGGVTPAWWKRSAIYMPRTASRITLDVTSVRVERLQSISETDALSEGPAPHPAGPTCAFSTLWRSINGMESWVQNPWVWVVEFRIAPTQQGERDE